MSSPRDGAGDGSDWQEPAHLSRDEPSGDEPNFADRRKQPRDDDPSTAGPAWQPAGWDLPPAEQPPVVQPPVGRPPGFGGPPRPRGAVAEVFAYEGDLVGAQGWALQHGWSITDGTGPEDAVLAQLIASSPVRPTKDHRAAGVMRGRADALELVAFDVVYPLGRSWIAQYAITAAPLLDAVPGFRLSPARFWRHRTGGLVPMVSGNEQFDARWLLLVAEDDPRLQRLARDPGVQGLLLGSDDGDEFWSAAGHVAAVRPDGHRPQLIEHHAKLLTAIVGALTSGY
ncbi:MAG TPA: hypothetical protein VGN47_07465 [Blastococcus sp.]|jgi:hypothetical protein|nr:hypothetical protein [Blastococcus sp.]